MYNKGSSGRGRGPRSYDQFSSTASPTFGGQRGINKVVRGGGGGGAPRRGGWKSRGSQNANPQQPSNPPPPPVLIEPTPPTFPVPEVARPPPPPAELFPAVPESPKLYDPQNAGEDPLAVLAMAPRIGLLSLNEVIDNWRKWQEPPALLTSTTAASNAAALPFVPESSYTPAKHCYPIAAMLKLKDKPASNQPIPNAALLQQTLVCNSGGMGSGLSHHTRRRSQPQSYSPQASNKKQDGGWWQDGRGHHDNPRQHDQPRHHENPRHVPEPPPVIPPIKRTDLARPVALRRQSKALLNRLTVEKFEAIAEMLVKDCLESCQDEEELMIVVDEVYKKAVSEPDFSEMYADLVLVLRAKSPQFPSASNKKPTDFQRCIVLRCQNEFELIPQYDPAAEEAALAKMSEEDAEAARMKRKRLILGNMRFIGELFMRRIIFNLALKQIVCVLLDSNKAKPEPHIIECMCELLTTIGFTLESQCRDTAKTILTTLGGLKDEYDVRIDCKIQDLLDLANNGWRQRNLHKAKATTLNDVSTHELESNVAGVQSVFPYKAYVHELDELYQARRKEARQKQKLQQSSP